MEEEGVSKSPRCPITQRWLVKELWEWVLKTVMWKTMGVTWLPQSIWESASLLSHSIWYKKKKKEVSAYVEDLISPFFSFSSWEMGTVLSWAQFLHCSGFSPWYQAPFSFSLLEKPVEKKGLRVRRLPKWKRLGLRSWQQRKCYWLEKKILYREVRLKTPRRCHNKKENEVY